MTPEKFRQWIVILFAALIVTMWVGFGMRLCGVHRYPMVTQRTGMRNKTPGRVSRFGAESVHRTPARGYMSTTKSDTPAKENE